MTATTLGQTNYTTSMNLVRQIYYAENEYDIEWLDTIDMHARTHKHTDRHTYIHTAHAYVWVCVIQRTVSRSTYRNLKADIYFPDKWRSKRAKAPKKWKFPHTNAQLVWYTQNTRTCRKQNPIIAPTTINKDITNKRNVADTSIHS